MVSKGKSSGVTCTFPVPIAWPEQEIEIVSQDKTENVGRVTFKKLGADAQIVVFKVNRLKANESAQATIKYRVKKKNIVAPAAQDQLMFAKSIPGPIKKFLKPSPYIEIKDDLVKQTAAKIEFDDNLPAWQNVEKIFDWVRTNIKYKFDPQIHSCMWALQNQTGDCEEMSSLFVAICRVKGIPARAVWIPDHTYPEFYLVDKQGVGHWIPCQAAGQREFGSMTERKPVMQKGDSFVVPGKGRKPIRYIEANLVARDSSHGLDIASITREIKGE